MHASSGVTRHLHFKQRDWGLLHVTAVTWDGTDTESDSCKCNPVTINVPNFPLSGTLIQQYSYFDFEKKKHNPLNALAELSSWSRLTRLVHTG